MANTTLAATGVTDEQVSPRRLTVISVVLVVGAITMMLDTTIVNIALDHLHTVFHATLAETQWVATGYGLAFVAVIPLSGWAAERFGARQSWLFAVAAFLAGSLLCGLAWSLPALIVFRVLQGIGGGMVLPISITILTRAAGPDRIGHAMVAVALPAQLAPILGPIIGGSMLDAVSWHWLFFVNVPICLAALVLGPLFLPAGQRSRGQRLDTIGFLLLTPGVAALAYGVSQSTGADGFAATRAWAPLALGAALLMAFTGHSLSARRPALLDVRVFARRSFGLSSIITFVAGFSTFALMFLLPIFYQQIRGETVLHTGLLLIPQGLGSMLFLVLSRRLSQRIDGRVIVAGGVILTMLGVVPFAVTHATGDQVLLLAAQFVQGIGMMATTLPVMTLAFASLSPAQAPKGSAAFSVVQRVGAPFGVAVIAVVLQNYLRHAATADQALGAFQQTFWWIIALSAVPLLLAFFMPTRRGERTPIPQEQAEPAGHGR